MSSNKYITCIITFLVLLSGPLLGCSANAERPYAQWASPDEFPGATKYWKQKKMEAAVPLATDIAIPRFNSAKLIRIENYGDKKGYLSRIVLATAAEFEEVVEWYRNKISHFCVAESDALMQSITLANDCMCEGRPIADEPMCLFTTTPNVTIKKVQKNTEEFFGDFRTVIEIAYP